MPKGCRWNIVVFLVVSLVPSSFAQTRCYPAGGVAGIVIATFVVTVVVVGLSLAAAWRIRRRKKALKKKGKDAPTVPEKIPGDFAFDNPYFRDQEEDENDGPDKVKGRNFGANRNPLRSSKQSDLSTKGKKSKGGKHFIFGGVGGGVGFGGGKKQRAFDDSCLPVEPERTVVSLRGHDFTGLGFNICGNMRDGILVKDVLHRGPASESGRIKAGDKILSVTVSFTNMVYEDALTILSYASPYDVQLELERIPDKSRAMHASPATSKRLASCSFSSGGQKLFHPLYRSQSIDDLTQIDKDTFPSHGIGPRRSQSVGVAAHKLAAHFKHTNAKMEERSPAAVILSTTGSLNEKMLANVMVEGGLQKSGLQWEKRFEDTLDSESSETNRTSGLGDSKRVTPSLTNKSHSLAKESISSTEGDRTDTSDEIPPSHHHYARDKHQYRGPALAQHKITADKYSLECSVLKPEAKSGALRTTAQIHHYNSREKRANAMNEASTAIWHLDQSIKDGDSGASVSDLDSSNAYSMSGGATDELYSRARRRKEKEYSTHSSSSEVRRNKNPKKSASSKRENEGDSDVSHDSLELGDKKLPGKKRNRRASSLGDLAQLEEAVNSAASVHENADHPMQQETEKSLNVGANIQKKVYQKSALKNGEKNNLSKGARSENSQTSEMLLRDTDYEADYPNSHGSRGNSSLVHICSKEQKLERLVNSRVSSPKFSIQNTKEYSNCGPGNSKESPRLKSERHQPTVSTNPAGQEKSNRNYRKAPRSESPKLGRKMPSYNEKYEINSSPNYTQYYGSNNNILLNKIDDNKSESLVQHNRPIYQQNPSSHRQMCGLGNSVDGVESKKSDLGAEVVTSSHHQFLRKAANPAGMFTQINPFHQPTRNKTNVVFKPWAIKEDSPKDLKMPVNSNTTFYTSVLPKQGQITTCDSVGHQRMKMDNSQDFIHRIDNNGACKTVIVSTGGRSSLRASADGMAPPMSYRLP